MYLIIKIRANPGISRMPVIIDVIGLRGIVKSINLPKKLKRYIKDPPSINLNIILNTIPALLFIAITKNSSISTTDINRITLESSFKSNN